MFYQQVNEGDEIYVRVAYFINAEEEENKKIDFFAVNPKGKVM